MSRPWSDTTKRIVTVTLFLTTVVILYRFRGIISPLTIALLIAYVLTPVVDALQRRTHMPRVVCILLVDLLAIGIVGVIPAVAAPALLSEMAAVNVDLSASLDSVSRYLTGTVLLLGYPVDLSLIYEQLSASLHTLVSPIVSSSLFFLIDIASGLLWSVFVFVVSLYLMRDWHRIGRYLHDAVPPEYREDCEQLLLRVRRIWQAFLRGQLVLSLVVGTAVALATGIAGVSSALVLGMLAGLLEAVPNVGPVVAAVPAIVLALLLGSSWVPLPNFWFAVIVAGLYVVIQQVENNYLVPRIIGGSVKLHPMVVIVGAIAGARLAGILGIFLAAPVLATLRVLLSYIRHKLLDTDPFAEPEAPVEPQAIRRSGWDALATATSRLLRGRPR